MRHRPRVGCISVQAGRRRSGKCGWLKQPRLANLRRKLLVSSMRVGGRDVVLNGAIVTQPGDDSLDLELSNLRFRIIFTGGDDNTVVGDAQGSLLTLRVSGFNNSLGTAWSSEVGTLGGKRLYLSLYGFSLGDADKLVRLINFTFTTG